MEITKETGYRIYIIRIYNVFAWTNCTNDHAISNCMNYYIFYIQEDINLCNADTACLITFYLVISCNKNPDVM